MTQYLVKLAEVGGSWILWVLIALSLFSTGVIVDRWWFFRRRRIDPTALAEALMAKLKGGDSDGAKRLLEKERAIEAQVLRSVLDWVDDGPDALVEALGASLRKERAVLEQGMVFLGTVGNNAPFIGLLGTVLGVVQAFKELGHANASAMGNVMAGIAEALVATAVGLAVALPAVIANNIFNANIGRVEDNIQQIISLLLAHQKSRREERRFEARVGGKA